MGSVYRATHVMLGKAVAVKVIRPELVISDDIVRRFQREARAAATLDHPNIVTVYDLGQADDGTLYIAMEFIDGRSLKDAIRRDGPMGYGQAVEILRQVADALSVAHQNQIIHRDLKSQNVMLTAGADGRVVAKLVDFGIAKTFDEPVQLTEAGFVLGTPHYMSPEQAAGKAVDHRADLYSLGVILYEMLAGDVPFSEASTTSILVKLVTEQPEPPSRRRTDVVVPAALEAIAMKCLEKDPNTRFQSAAELRAALAQPLEAEPTRVRTPAVIPAIPAASRRSWILAAAFAAAIPVVGALAFGMVGPRSSPKEPVHPSIPVARPIVDVRQPEPVAIAPPAPVKTPVPAPPLRQIAVAPPVPVAVPTTPPPAIVEPPREVKQAAAPPVRPEHPPVFVDCDGVPDICAPIRAEIVSALRTSDLPVVRDPGLAEVELTATVSVVGEVGSLDFGTPIVTRTYSVAVIGESKGVELVMPPARNFSFDARFGGARLQENARVIAAGAVEAVREFWVQAGR
jgi:serine/threonine-protein kinase